MATTFELISSVTVGAGGAASIDFTSIPSTYTDLCLKISGRTDNSDAQTLIWFNNDTNAANYLRIRLIGDGSSASSASASDSKWLFVVDSNKTSNTFGSGEIYIPNYTSSNQKSVSIDGTQENNATYTIDGLFAGKWSGTSAINRITVAAQTGNFTQYSTAYLYGVKNA